MITVDRALIETAIDTAGTLLDLRIEESYSGRGMAGERDCFALRGEERDFMLMLIKLAILDKVVARDMVRAYRADSLGREKVFYFPGMALE